VVEGMLEEEHGILKQAPQNIEVILRRAGL